VRYLLQPENKPVLTWLLEKDPAPSAAPVFPEGDDLGLVVAYLLNGVCYAEVLINSEQLVETCGSGFPFGRLFFHVKRQDLYSACDALTKSSFGGLP
jgi:hypothetical protein